MNQERSEIQNALGTPDQRPEANLDAAKRLAEAGHSAAQISVKLQERGLAVTEADAIARIVKMVPQRSARNVGLMALFFAACEPVLFAVTLAQIRSPALGLALRDAPAYGIVVCAIIAFFFGLSAYSRSKGESWLIFSIIALSLPILFFVLFSVAIGVSH